MGKKELGEALAAERVEKGVRQARVVLENPSELSSYEGKRYLAETLLLVVEENEGLLRRLKRLEARAKKDEANRGVARASFGEVVNRLANEEAIEQLVEDALQAKSLASAYCSMCRKRVQVEIPDIKKRVDVITMLLEQAEGKPGGEESGLSIVVERPPLRGSAPAEPVLVEADLTAEQPL